MAPRIAAAVRTTWVDLDDKTLAILGSDSISRAWVTHGEALFRAAESRALADALDGLACVIALGGGTPTAPGAGDLLRRARAAGAALIYLRATPGVLKKRLARGGAGDRPSLTGRGVVEEVGEVFDARDPIYRGLATGVVEVGGLDEAGVGERVLGLIEGLVC